MSGSPSAAVEMPDAGRPFDGPTILAQMRTSPRPDGVPDRLETDAIAAAVADAIWTFDGMPWTTMAIGASCGETTCLLDVAGSRPTATAEDLWVFEVEPTTAAVRVVTAELRAIPPETVAQLDRLARGGVSEPGALDAMALTTARWTPPPEPARFLLSYRTGGEEGSCAAELAIDGATGRVVTETFVDC